MLRVLVPPELSPTLRINGPPAGPVQHFAGNTMGTTWSIKLAGPVVLPPAALRTDLQQILDAIVAQMSSWEPNSVLSCFNRAPAGSWHVLPEEFFSVLRYSLDLACSTGGAFDPTIGALTCLWGFGPRPQRSEPPEPHDIATARSRCGWRRVVLDVEHRRAQQGGIELDLSGVAKGFAVDRLAEYLTDLGVDHYLVEVGGELRGRGCKPDGSPWWVAVEPAEPGAPGLEQTTAALHEMAVATSGDYRRYFEHRGQRYAHTLDPRSGCPTGAQIAGKNHAFCSQVGRARSGSRSRPSWPPRHKPIPGQILPPAAYCPSLDVAADRLRQETIASVTVFHAACMQADALATALTVLGPRLGTEYAGQHDIAALFVLRTPHGLEEQLTPALESFLSSEA